MNLLERAQQIKNETQQAANTANRVGSLLEFIVNTPALDSEFAGNTTPQTVTDEWSDINTDFGVHYSNLVSWDADTKSFLYEDGDFPRSIRIDFNIFVESASNNQDFEFGIFIDAGEGLQLIGAAFPYTIRQQANTEAISIGSRFDIVTDTRFKLRVRKPSGSSDLTFLNAKVLI